MRVRVLGLRAAMCASLIATVVASAGLAPSAVAHGHGHGHGHGEDPAVVRTQDGRVKGVVHATYREFSGIPYAAPPVGPLRWKPPLPAARWSGVLDATQLPIDCPQPTSWDQATNTAVQVTNEDCLRLNVVTPPVARHGHERLPVLVWIHGGAWVNGGGRYVDPSQLAAEGDVVVVTINYRLGALGFLDHPSLDGPDGRPAEGNYGLMDQQLALRWVARNIDRFGGDPHRVTIGGESSGGGAVCAQLASPAARGLFDRAILESPWNPRCTFDERPAAEAHGAELAAQVGCRDAADVAACLRATPVADLFAAQASTLWPPVVGGSILPQRPFDALASGRYNRVPTLIGSNHDESLFGQTATAADAEAFVRTFFGGDHAADQVLAHYPLGDYPDPAMAVWTAVGDVNFACSARTVAGLLERRVPTFAYEFNDPNPPIHPFEAPFFGPSPHGAFHGSELKYWIRWLRDPSPFDAAQQALSQRMIRYWSRFIATGNPNGSGLPSWPAYRRSSDRYLSLRPGGDAVISDFADDHQCAFWDTADFPLPTA